MKELQRKFGRPLRLGIIGGGPGFVDRPHASRRRGAGRLVARVAGVFSSDPARSRAAGAALGFEPARSYGDVTEMLARERARADGIDAVAIMTPNDTHYALRRAPRSTPGSTSSATSR